MVQGSDDLNMLLKARVIKILAELDVKKSLPIIKRQVGEISTLLEGKPIKLNVELDTSIAEMNKQLKLLSRRLAKSKTFKPIKIGVEIDVDGSAKQIKDQLKGIHNTVEKFNKEYGQQLRNMKRMQSEYSKTVGKANVPMNADVKNFNNIKKYVSQLKEAERIMRSKSPKGKGLFSSFEIKDAEGNLKGFTSALERADGVVEKVRYNWNKDKNAFEVIDRHTATQTEKNVHKSMESLKDLQREISKTGDKTQEFEKEYNEMMNAGVNGNLTKDAVRNFQTRIKNQQAVLQQTKRQSDALREQKKIIASISRLSSGVGKGKTRGRLDNLKNKTINIDVDTDESIEELKKLKHEMNELSKAYKHQEKAEKTLTNLDDKRLSVLSDLYIIQKKSKTDIGYLSDKYIDETRALASNVKTMKEYNIVRQRMNRINEAKRSDNLKIDISKNLDKLKKDMIDYAIATGKSTKSIEKYYDKMEQNIGGNLAEIQQKQRYYTKKTADFKLKNKLDIMKNSVVPNVDNNELNNLVGKNDIAGIKNYISKLYKADVATVKLIQTSKGIHRIQTEFESTGKTARQMTHEINTADKKLRMLQDGLTYNRNANLGVFEQLRIAMARVPVWMTAMTVFYGSIRSIQAITREILELDKAMTELRRVADAGVNIDALFQGAIDMSKELGNNVHDVLQSLNDFSRTFGNFNERQLLSITKTATLMANVSDLNVQESAENLISTMNAFNITAEDSIKIVDSLNEVDNNYAVSTKQLSEGLSKTASVAQTFGVTMEETVGHITAISSVTMESGKLIGKEIAV